MMPSITLPDVAPSMPLSLIDRRLQNLSGRSISNAKLGFAHVNQDAVTVVRWAI